MSNSKQNTTLGEATRGTSLANISEAMDAKEKQKIMEQLQMPGTWSKWCRQP